jgi:hypothetical protein
LYANICNYFVSQSNLFANLAVKEKKLRVDEEKDFNIFYWYSVERKYIFAK